MVRVNRTTSPPNSVLRYDNGCSHSEYVFESDTHCCFSIKYWRNWWHIWWEQVPKRPTFSPEKTASLKYSCVQRNSEQLPCSELFFLTPIHLSIHKTYFFFTTQALFSFSYSFHCLGKFHSFSCSFICSIFQPSGWSRNWSRPEQAFVVDAKNVASFDRSRNVSQQRFCVGSAISHGKERRWNLRRLWRFVIWSPFLVKINHFWGEGFLWKYLEDIRPTVLTNLCN